MKKYLVQLGNSECEPMLKATQKWHSDYCKRHGYEYICCFDGINHNPFSASSMGQIFFHKCLKGCAQGEVKNNALAVMLDADTVIQHPSVDLKDAIKPDTELAMLGNKFFVNSGVIVCRNLPIVRAFFDIVMEKGPVRENCKVIDARFHEELQHPQIKFQFLGDKWNFFEKYGEVGRTVFSQKKDAVVLAWHGQDKAAALREMKRTVGYLMESEE